jgi:hypothetical protein
MSGSTSRLSPLLTGLLLSALIVAGLPPVSSSHFAGPPGLQSLVPHASQAVGRGQTALIPGPSSPPSALASQQPMTVAAPSSSTANTPTVRSSLSQSGSYLSFQAYQTGAGPAATVYDPLNGWMYVENSRSNNITVFSDGPNGTYNRTSINAGSFPEAGIFDSSNGWIYVVNEYSNNTTIVNSTKVVTTLSLGFMPECIAFDPATGLVYIGGNSPTNNGTIAIYNGTRLDATLYFVEPPIPIYYDPVNGYMYALTNDQSDNGIVYVLNGSLLVATLSVGLLAGSGAVDTINGEFYVSAWESALVSVINGSRVVGHINVSGGPDSMAFDSANGEIYVDDFYGLNVTIINGTQTVADVYIGEQCSGLSFDPLNDFVFAPGASGLPYDYVFVLYENSLIQALHVGNLPMMAVVDYRTGDVFVPNLFSHNVSVIVTIAYPITFHEEGLPNGTTWSVDLSDGEVSVISSNTSITVALGDGFYDYTPVSGDTHYQAPGGSLTVNGSAGLVNVTFHLVTYDLQFDESGLSSGLAWSVSVQGYGLGESVSPAPIVFEVDNGTLNYSVGGLRGWNPSPAAGLIVISGKGEVVVVLWSQFLYDILFTERGLPSRTAWSVVIDGVRSNNTTVSSLSQQEPNGTYEFEAVSSDSTYAAPNGAFAINGAGQNESILFTRLTYAVDVQEMGLPTAANWSVSLGDQTIGSHMPMIQIFEPNGTYSYSFGRISGWAPAPSRGALTVLGSPTALNVTWERVTYSVLFTEVGLPPLTNWSIQFNNLTQSGSGPLSFTQVPNGSYVYQVLPVNGFSTSVASGRVDVQGFRASVTVNFVPTVLNGSNPVSSGSLRSLETYILIGGILTGGLIGLAIILRRSRRGNGPDEPR